MDGVIDIRDVPDEIAALYVGNVMIIVPKLDTTRYLWFVDTADTEGFSNHANEIFQKLMAFEESLENIEISNMEDVPFAMRDITRLILVFIYGFIIMLTLIGLTNVISTISTNLRSRTREFAVLCSVGLTPAGIKRMLNLESLLCSAKSLMIGVPLGILGSYVLYRVFSSPVDLDYVFPWMPIVQCILSIIAITWVIMRYSVSRLCGDNIIETIRSQNR